MTGSTKNVTFFSSACVKTDVLINLVAGSTLTSSKEFDFLFTCVPLNGCFDKLGCGVGAYTCQGILQSSEVDILKTSLAKGGSLTPAKLQPTVKVGHVHLSITCPLEV